MGKSYSPPPLQPPQHNLESASLNLENKISPSIILIIIILAIIFFVSGLLHLLVRFLLRPNQRDPDEFLDNVTALQGQLQQLFHLHDAGVDQSYIDTLPIFQYKTIIGLKDPFDCAVCLCEFEGDDKLRLLPKCSHAFHVDCIDTWLLSHSTCPLCRASLLQEINSQNQGFSPIVCVLESGSMEASRELERENRDPGSGSNRHQGEGEFGSNRIDFRPRKSTDNMQEVVKKEDKIVTVKLGKFKNVEGGEGSSEITITNNSNNNNQNNGSSSNNNLGSRRCYSMGSFAYVMDETTALQVPIRTPMKKEKNGKKGGLKAGYRAAMSEYGCDSRREFNGIEGFRSVEFGKGNGNGNGNESSSNNNNNNNKRESFSISKIWLRGGEKNKKGNGNWNNGNDCDYSSRRTISEFEIDVSELGIDEETQSCYSVDSLANPTTTNSSSTRRTLLWLMGRQNKIVHNHSSSFSSNI
ncbi:RING-H2 finger protein ATL13 [Beta vulgaris subsp. vulgaris]|uniref:RING-H2 finger protein ATL13 n=1 Tax=Beta vulgaris subsp. vulgaris TaxID=3555 RepID=UPI002036BE95|nr:RING-H2 finger protein ATL13 [Beta vulgaris subsp. vulgaris]